MWDENKWNSMGWTHIFYSQFICAFKLVCIGSSNIDSTENVIIFLIPHNKPHTTKTSAKINYRYDYRYFSYCEVKLTSITVTLLKEWNVIHQTILFDRKYLKELLRDGFLAWNVQRNRPLVALLHGTIGCNTNHWIQLNCSRWNWDFLIISASFLIHIFSYRFISSPYFTRRHASNEIDSYN